MAESKVELVIDDLYDTIIEYKAEKTYCKLYEDFNEKLKKIFVYFHSEFNQLFSFMNEKNKANKHFNAEPSRHLINIIGQFNDFYNVLSGSEKQIEINEKYLATIKRCESFLNASGGSAIPEDFDLIELIKYEPIFAMANQMVRVNEDIYNLLVSVNEEAWESESYILDLSRFLEYTDQDLKDKFIKLGKDEINEIIKYPCIFAYEDSCEQDAGVGYITDIIVRQGKIKISFQKREVLSLESLHGLKFELDIGDWELNRTHWAIKKSESIQRIADFAQ